MENTTYELAQPVDIIYSTGCLKANDVVNFCKENNIKYNLLEWKVNDKATSLLQETPISGTPAIFDSGGWLVADYNTYEKMLGPKVQ